VKTSFNLGEWLSDKLSSFSPRTLAWSATAAALAIVLQAGLLAGMFVNEKQGGALFDTASISKSEPAMAGTYALISFAPQASAADITRLMQTYNMKIVEGPSGEMFTVKLALTGMPKEDLARLIKQLQDEKTVRFVGQKSAE